MSASGRSTPGPPLDRLTAESDSRAAARDSHPELLRAQILSGCAGYRTVAVFATLHFFCVLVEAQTCTL